MAQSAPTKSKPPQIGALFQKAVKQNAFAKIELLGFPGSGKTRTATDMVIGLHKLIGSKRPIGLVDNETGTDFVLDRFAAEQIAVERARTVSFTDLAIIVRDGPSIFDILLIDTITKFWVNIQERYMAKINGERAERGLPKISKMEFHNWAPIKEQWRQKFTEVFLSVPMHVIFCGRAGFEYDYEENEGGSKDLVKTGTKLKADNELSFEPSLVIEMERVEYRPGFGGVKKKRASKAEAEAAQKLRQVINRAFVRKDRADKIDGRYFDNPTFECWLPHFKELNLGGAHVALDVPATDSAELFTGEGRSTWDAEKNARARYVEEIEALLFSVYPGQAGEQKKARLDALMHYFQTRSMLALNDISSESLQSSWQLMRRDLEPQLLDGSTHKARQIAENPVPPPAATVIPPKAATPTPPPEQKRDVPTQSKTSVLSQPTSPPDQKEKNATSRAPVQSGLRLQLADSDLGSPGTGGPPPNVTLFPPGRKLELENQSRDLCLAIHDELGLTGATTDRALADILKNASMQDAGDGSKVSLRLTDLIGCRDIDWLAFTLENLKTYNAGKGDI